MYCTHCGAALSPSVNFCAACGTRVGEGRLEGVTMERPVVSPVSSTDPRSADEPARYASFWGRFAASFLDGLVLVVINVLAFTAIGAFAASSSATEEASLAWAATFYLASWIIGWLYFAFLHSSERQASLGKRALGIKVVTPSGERIGFGRATGRYFAYLFNSIFTLGIGFVIAAFTARRQSLHDMMAGTLVVTRDASAKDVIAGLAEPKASGGVVAVAVVACLVPAVGVVAAIAIPAYQDYTIRSQVLEGLTLASSYKASVSAAYAGGTAFEEMTSESLGLEGPDGAYVDNIEVISGVVQVTYGGEAHQNLAGRTLLLVPAETDAGDLRWICGKASAPDDVAPAIDGWTQYTDVEGKYLPPTCRG